MGSSWGPILESDYSEPQRSVAAAERCFLWPGSGRELYNRHSLGQNSFGSLRLASVGKSSIGDGGGKCSAVYRRIGGRRFDHIAGRASYTVEQSARQRNHQLHSAVAASRYHFKARLRSDVERPIAPLRNC